MTEKKIIYSYQESFDATKDYFNGDELAASVFLGKYCLKDNEDNLYEKTPTDMHWRLAKEFARVESTKFKKSFSKQEIFDLFDKFKYIVPQGSPMFGIGNDFQIISLSNCYLCNAPEDSYSSILKTDEQLVNISKRRGGVGIDLSKLRPKGSITLNSARKSTGIVSWMERYSNSIREVGQENRRGALMLTLDIHHPDIVDFCTIKNDATKVTGANISVRLSKEFVDALENDKEYELRFPVDYKEKGVEPKISKWIKAKDIWNIIIKSAHGKAEPGILAWYNVTKNTPADCYERYASTGTNPCSELNLSELDSCRLLIQVLLSYVVNPYTKDAYFDYNLFYQHAKIAQRLMDDMVDLESEKIDKIIAKIKSDPESDNVKKNEIEMWEQIKANNNEGRRTGTGITALGDALAALGIKYGSKESISVSEQIIQTMKFACYESSIEMAKELGSFKEFDWEKEKDCEFFKRFQEEEIELDDTYIEGRELINRMKKYGRRNVSLTTISPTGSVSILTQTTSGLEPLFMLSYTRRKKINHNDSNTTADFIDQSGDKWEEFEVYHKRIEDWKLATGLEDIKKSPWYGSCAEEIDWINRVKLQGAIQKHICHSISSTINLPEDVTEKEVGSIYLEAFKRDIKGLTVYRKNCRSGVLVESKVQKRNDAQKRPEILPCDIFHPKMKGQEYFVVVGMLSEMPYEIFVGKLDFDLNDNKQGFLQKMSRGKYKLLGSNQEILCNNVCDYLTNDEDVFTRLLSTSFRHMVPLEFVVHQIEKTTGELHNPAKVVTRILKQYIKDGVKITGDSCSQCNSPNIERSGGCPICKDCGYSKCI